MHVMRSPDPYDHNFRRICEFSGEDSAWIKVDPANNKLMTSKDASYGYAYIYGTKFDETAKQINFTASKSLEEFEDKFKLVEEKLKSADDLTDNELEKLKTDFKKELMLLDGMMRINDVYHKRYREEKDHVGLEEMQSSVTEFGTNIMALLERFKQVVDEYNDRGAGKHVTTGSMEFPTGGTISNKARESLPEYCEAFCPGISYSEAKEMVEVGEQLFHLIMEGKLIEPAPDDDISQQQLSAITWYLMSKAIEKKQGFEEGTFVIEDIDDRLYNFLNNHPHAYDRPSSHYVGRSPETHRGVDVINGQMPAHKRTLLFERVKNPDYMESSSVLFIKPENFGFTTTGDTLGHIYEFVVAQINKKLYPGSDDLPTMRKERVPVNILKAFGKVVDLFEKDIKDYPRASEVYDSLTQEDKNILDLEKGKRNAAVYGISYMVRFVDLLEKIKKDAEMYPAFFDEQLEEFKKSIEGYDILEKRTGREVCLMTTDFKIT